MNEEVKLKLVIFAGGLGTRLSEETKLTPKPMVMIGERPILWHIMKYYSTFGVNEFIICAGYKQEVIKDYFINYRKFSSEVTVDLESNEIEFSGYKAEKWRVTIVDTGENAQTALRLFRVMHQIGEDEDFFLTYGDGLSDVNITELNHLHQSKNRTVTVTAVASPGRFGSLDIEGDRVVSFKEKPINEAWINGGYFVCNGRIRQYLTGENVPWETIPMGNLVADDQLTVHKHYGFWKPMDTLREKHELELMLKENKAPWVTW